MKQNKPLEKNIDYTINEDGDLVFTRAYHLKRGHCCQNACINCPYGFIQKTDPLVPAEYSDAWDSDFETDDIEQDQ